MDKSNGKDWFAKTLNSVTEESAKVYSVSENSIEISTLKKSISERKSLLIDKLLTYINEGKIDAKLFDPEYSKILKLELDVEELIGRNKEIKSNLAIPFGEISEFAKGVKSTGGTLFSKIKTGISDCVSSNRKKV